MIFVHVKYNFHPSYGYQINELLNVQKNSADKIIVISTKDMSYFEKEYDKKDDEIFMEKTGIQIIRLDYFFKIASRVWFKNLNSTLRNINPDVVFFHGIGDFCDLQLFKRKKKYKIFRDCHMSWVASTRKGSNLFYKVYKFIFAKIINKTEKYTKIFALGVEEYQYLKALGISDEKIDYLYHGYNGEIMYYDEEERKKVRNQYGITQNEILISYIGKFNYSKRPDLIIDIVNKLDEDILKNKKIKILFMGSKDIEYMELFNDKLKILNNNIEIIVEESKKFNELRKYFSASDICIFPKETTLSSIHAQVCGCPVIMEKHISNKERVVDNNNLYGIDNIREGTKKMENVILSEKYLKEKNLALSKNLENREYKIQIEKLLELIEE